MERPVKHETRRYRAPQRDAAASRTRQAVMGAAKDVFERLGWSGATMRGVADEAGVSLKTVEALYGTKAGLLKSAVDYAIAGDLRPIAVIEREGVAAMEAAVEASAMLELHASHVRSINVRTVRLAWVVEQAAPAHDEMAKLWAQIEEGRRFGTRWAASTLLQKRGLAAHVDQAYAEDAFWLAIDFGTYRSLTRGRGLTPSAFEAWISDFYARMFLR